MRQPFDQRHPLLRAQDEDAFRNRVGEDGAVGRESSRCGTGAPDDPSRVEDVMVADGVLHEEARVIARCAERAVAQLESSRAAAVRPARIVDAELSTAGRPCGPDRGGPGRR